MGDRKKTANGCSSDIYRLSDLPDSVLHLIISFVGTKQACQTTILSKRWLSIWSTGLILDFNPRLFENVPRPSRETFNRFVPFIEATMQRYSDQNLSIRKLRLKDLNVDTEMPSRIDRWLEIAVKNQVENLTLDLRETLMAPCYGLPMILFSAKSLIILKCYWVRVPHCLSVTRISLQSLDLSYVDIDEHTPHHIIMLCPLKKLRLNRCFGITNLSIPDCSKLEFPHVKSTIRIVKVETYSIQYFSYCGHHKIDSGRPFNFSLATKNNLRELKLSFADILDNVVDKLVSELLSIRKISFRHCTMPNNIGIASLTLQKLAVAHCNNLANIGLDAPQLKNFVYYGGL